MCFLSEFWFLGCSEILVKYPTTFMFSVLTDFEVYIVENWHFHRWPVLTGSANNFFLSSILIITSSLLIGISKFMKFWKPEAVGYNFCILCFVEFRSLHGGKLMFSMLVCYELPQHWCTCSTLMISFACFCKNFTTKFDANIWFFCPAMD